MLGLMQDWPLLCHRIIDHAATYHTHRPVVSRSVEGPIHRTDYGQLRGRALRVAQRLARDGIGIGDRIATLAWNTWRHVETWYGVFGVGAICHTVNPRLFPDQIAWIVNDAQDRVMIEGQQRNMDDVAVDKRKPVFLEVDAGPVRFRRIMDELIEKERAALIEA